jgi:hypothetical protein
MGIYINPPKGTKEQFLAACATPISREDFMTFSVPDDCLPVALVNNGAFTAAGVAYDLREVECFTHPTDFRPKKFYCVEKSKLLDESLSGIPHFYHTNLTQPNPTTNLRRREA